MTAKGQRSTLSCATYLRNVLESKWRQHVKTCGKCLTTTAVRDRYCDEGWEIVKDLTEARSRVTQLRVQLAEDYPHLF